VTTNCPAAGATLDASTSCDFTNLLAGTTYSVSVTATDRSGVESVAAISSFTSGPRYVHSYRAALLHAKHNKVPSGLVSACVIGAFAVPPPLLPAFSASQNPTLPTQKS
jgi:hypothetical protein